MENGTEIDGLIGAICTNLEIASSQPHCRLCYTARKCGCPNEAFRVLALNLLLGLPLDRMEAAALRRLAGAIPFTVEGGWLREFLLMAAENAFLSDAGERLLRSTDGRVWSLAGWFPDGYPSGTLVVCNPANGKEEYHLVREPYSFRYAAVDSPEPQVVVDLLEQGQPDISPQ